MKIIRHTNFKKNYQKRILPNKKLDRQFKRRLQLFLLNQKNPLLKDHQLIGKKKEFRAFSVSGDVRVVYKIFDDEILLYDIGTHNQVY